MFICVLPYYFSYSFISYLFCLLSVLFLTSGFLLFPPHLAFSSPICPFTYSGLSFSFPLILPFPLSPSSISFTLVSSSHFYSLPTSVSVVLFPTYSVILCLPVFFLPPSICHFFPFLIQSYLYSSLSASNTAGLFLFVSLFSLFFPLPVSLSLCPLPFSLACSLPPALMFTFIQFTD